jgi:hypothetical protein
VLRRHRDRPSALTFTPKATGAPFFTPRAVRSIAISAAAVSLTVGGGAAVANDAKPMVQFTQFPAQAAVSSAGVKFFGAGQTELLGRAGHFTFSASCSEVDGQNQVSFDVVADTTAALDGNAPARAGTKVNIHTDSDALNGVAPGTFTQVHSASASTSIAKDGQEVDVFYTDGVNWPAVDGLRGHDCFAGFTGIIG